MANSRKHHARFEAMTQEQRLSYSAVGGHAPLSFFRGHLGDMEGYHKIVTLRDPIDRVISEYNYIRTRPQHRMHRIVGSQSFEDFIETTAQPNRQVKLLTGRGDDVDGAVGAVQQFFDDWSLSNDVGQMIERLYEVTHTTPRLAKRKNVGKSGFWRADVAPATLRLLEEKNRHDLALIEALRRVRAQ